MPTEEVVMTMPKMTAKYSAALYEARRLDIDFTGSQEDVYNRLQQAGLMWDSEQKLWIEMANEPADPATLLVAVRVWADAEVVEEAADVVADGFERAGFSLVERSNPYPCRPPKQLEARVYLKLMPPAKERGR